MKWKHFLRYWPFVWGIHRSLVNSPTKASDVEFDVFFDLHLNKRLSKQSWGWWFEMPSCPLWHHCNAIDSWYVFNMAIIFSSWLCDTIWQHRSGSTLAQVMACCLIAPSHYLNQFNLPSVRLCGIHLWAISQWVFKLIFCIMSLRIMLLKSLPHLPWVSGLNSGWER